jgi:hypothetical protein
MNRRVLCAAVALAAAFPMSSAVAETYEIRTKIPGLQAQSKTDFTSHTFTTCGKSGRSGPALSQCQAAYSGSEVLNDGYEFNVTAGVQKWRVPVDGNYRILAKGAEGGYVPGYSSRGGRGAVMEGDFSLQKGSILNIVVAQKGGNEMNKGYGGGGGGGASFVYEGAVGGGGGFYGNGTTSKQFSSSGTFSGGEGGKAFTAGG